MKAVAMPVTITPAMVAVFADCIGDRNSIHLDAEFAAKTPFGKPIVHGAYFEGLISAALAQAIGEGAIYIGQTVKFRRPGFVGDHFHVIVTPKEMLSKNGALLETTVTNDQGDVIVEGEAMVKLPLPS